MIRLRNWVETNKKDGTPLAVRRLADLEFSGGRLKIESAGSLASRETGLWVTSCCLASPTGDFTHNATFQAESSTTTLFVEFVDSRHAGRPYLFLA